MKDDSTMRGCVTATRMCVQEDGMSCFLAACLHGKIDVVKYFIEQEGQELLMQTDTVSNAL